MIYYEEKVIAMLEEIVRKQDEALKLMYEINGKPIPIITEEKREWYRNYIRKRLGLL